MTLYTVQHAYTGEILSVHDCETADDALTAHLEGIGLGRSEDAYEVGGVLYTVCTNYEISAVPNLATSDRRYAVVLSSCGAMPEGYLPHNYTVERREVDGRRSVTLVSGFDVAGWTLDGYVLPRLASGLHYGHEARDFDDAVASFYDEVDSFLRVGVR